jgi:DNA-binding NarL/FixJ family response regulator
MPNGMDVVHRLRACAPQARHVVVSADNQPSTALEAIDAAACGYLPKTADCAWILSFGPWPGLKRTTG